MTGSEVVCSEFGPYLQSLGLFPPRFSLGTNEVLTRLQPMATVLREPVKLPLVTGEGHSTVWGETMLPKSAAPSSAVLSAGGLSLSL